MARIYKKNNSYYFSIEAGRDTAGKRQRIVRGGFKTKKEAQKASSELEVKFNTGSFIVKPTDISLHDFLWNHWLEYHKSFVKPSTLRNIQSNLKYIDKYFGTKIRLKDVTPAEFSKFTRNLLTYMQRATAVQPYNYLKMAFKYAVQVEKILISNPCENISFPKYTISEKEQIKNSKQTKLLFLEKEQLKKFLMIAENDKRAFPYYTVIMIMTYTGMRIGEVSALQWEDIDLENKLIHVRHTLFRAGKKYDLLSAKTESSIRDIILSDTIIKHIKEYRKAFLMFKLQNNNKWLDKNFNFVISAQRRPGEPLYTSVLAAWLNKISIKADLPHIHSHIFRHTHVSLLAEAGIPLSTIRERLGHSHDKITEDIYLHVTKKNKADAAIKFERLMANY